MPLIEVADEELHVSHTAIALLQGAKKRKHLEDREPLTRAEETKLA